MSAFVLFQLEPDHAMTLEELQVAERQAAVEPDGERWASLNGEYLRRVITRNAILDLQDQLNDAGLVIASTIESRIQALVDDVTARSVFPA